MEMVYDKYEVSIASDVKLNSTCVGNTSDIPQFDGMYHICSIPEIGGVAIKYGPYLKTVRPFCPIPYNLHTLTMESPYIWMVYGTCIGCPAGIY
jgi:hypothetical protein